LTGITEVLTGGVRETGITELRKTTSFGKVLNVT
jgi:hypothetical protein